jgi:hypothetical protein
MRMTIGLCVLASIIGRASAAQDKPDFSGQWVLVSSADVGADAARELAISQTIGTPGAILVVERRSKDGVHSERYRTGVRVFVERRDGSNTRLSVRWDGDTLVIERDSYSGQTADSPPDTAHQELWSIDPNGMLVMTVADRSVGAEPRTTKLVYRRR